MHFDLRLLSASLLSFSVACAGSRSEEPTASAATEGAETPPAPAPMPVAPQQSPEQPAPAAQPAQVQVVEMPPYAAVAIYEVKDFDAWKDVFDSLIGTRKEAGVTAEGIMRGADDDKIVVVYLPAADAQQLKTLLASNELAAPMKRAGVEGKPTVLVFRDEGGKMAPLEKTGLYGAILQCKVEDFREFRTAVEEQDAALSSAGILGWGLGQSVDSDSVAFLYLQSDDPEQLRAYLNAKDTKHAMKNAGVRGQPKTVIVQEGSMTMYQ